MIKSLAVFLLVLLCSVYSVNAQFALTDVNITTPTYSLGQNQVNYASVPLGGYTHSNPVTVTISPAPTTGTVGLCVSANSDTWISGANLADGCPPGAYAPFTSSNATFQLNLPVLGLAPLTIASMNDASGNFTFLFEMSYCMQAANNCSLDFNTTYCGSYPVNGMCVGNSVQRIYLSAGSSFSEKAFTAPAFGWAYAELIVNGWGNYLNVTPEFPTVTAYFQQNYLPNQNWNLDSYTDENEDGQTTYTVFTPGYLSGTQTYYVGFYNPSSIEIYSSFNVSLTNCETQGQFGPYCSANSTLIVPLNGTQNASPLEEDLTDSDYNGEYQYFVLKAASMNATADYIRVSVGNNVIDYTEENTLAPALFAKRNGYPSAQSWEYMANGSLANQMIVPLDSSVDWYFAVPLPNDFTIWTVDNCASNCSSAGTCTTSGQVFALPPTTSDVAGQCSCTDDDYDQSFDCSEKTNSNSTLYVVLIAIGGAIVLAVAIGVPIYCYIQNRRRSRFNQGYDALVDDTPQ